MGFCPRTIEIERSLDGAPAEPGTAPIEAHLEECPNCRARAEAIQALDAFLAAGLLARNRRLQRVSPRLVSRIAARGEEEAARRRERLARAAAGGQRQRPRPRGARTGAGAALAALALASALFGLAQVLAPERDEGPRAAASRLVDPVAPTLAARSGRPGAEGVVEDRPLSSGTGAPAPAEATSLEAWPARPMPVEDARGGESGGSAAEPEAAPVAEGPSIEAAVRPEREPAAVSAPSKGPVLPLAGAPAGPELRPVAVAGATVLRDGAYFGAEPATPDGAVVRIDHMRGDLRVARAGAAEFARVAGRTLEVAPGDRLRAEGGGASIGLANGTEIVLRAGTELLLACGGPGDPLAISLARGEVLADVVPGIEGNGLRIRTPAAEARALGTRFAVRAGHDHAALLVREGRVAIESAAGAAEVPAGEAAHAGPATVPAPRVASDAEIAAIAPLEKLRARRTTLFETGFERGAGIFEGALVRARGGRALALRPIRDQHWGERAAARRAGLFRARPGAEIRFAYYLPEPSTILVQAYVEPATPGAARRGPYRAVILAPAVGRWATAVVLASDLERVAEGRRERAQEGDAFGSLEIFAGRSGLPVHLLIDDFAIFERD